MSRSVAVKHTKPPGVMQSSIDFITAGGGNLSAEYANRVAEHAAFVAETLRGHETAIANTLQILDRYERTLEDLHVVALNQAATLRTHHRVLVGLILILGSVVCSLAIWKGYGYP